MNYTKSEKRIYFFDLAKGLAIWSVVCFHVMNDMQSEGVRQLLFYEILNILQLPIFFFISGYFLSAKLSVIGYKDLLIRYIPKRFRQLICPVFCFSMVYILYRKLNGDISYNFFNILGGSNPYWFLICLFNYTLIYSITVFCILTWNLTFRNISTNKEFSKICMWLACILLLTIVVIICKSDFCINALCIRRTIFYMPSFLFGMIVGCTKRYCYKNIVHILSTEEEYLPTHDSRFKNFTTASIFIFSSLLTLFYILPKIGITFTYQLKLGYLLHQTLTLSGVVLVMILCYTWELNVIKKMQKPMPQNNTHAVIMVLFKYMYSIFGTFGKYSLGIYLIHYFFRMNLNAIGDIFGWQFLPVFCTSVVISLIIIALSLLVIKIGQQSVFINKYLLAGK